MIISLVPRPAARCAAFTAGLPGSSSWRQDRACRAVSFSMSLLLRVPRHKGHHLAMTKGAEHHQQHRHQPQHQHHQEHQEHQEHQHRQDARIQRLGSHRSSSSHIARTMESRTARVGSFASVEKAVKHSLTESWHIRTCVAGPTKETTCRWSGQDWSSL